MTPDKFYTFFAASAGVAGALIGLLFVAMSVAGERLAERDELQVNRIRARTALVAFFNALVVSLLALIPDQPLGYVSAGEATFGLLFIAGCVLSLIRLRRLGHNDFRDVAFLTGLAVTFVVQLIAAVFSLASADPDQWIRIIATVIVICFSIGITHSWTLIGGPTVGIEIEAKQLVSQALERRTRKGGKA